MAFGSYVRFNPEHAPASAPVGGQLKTPQVQGGAPRHVASMVSMGPMTQHLGHFQNPAVLRDGHNTMHSGFKAVQSQIASKEGVSKDRAGAILSASTRRASASAKRKNPRLNRVKG